ncbi:MAG: hypothetical protein SGILL_006643 [Bacillariaceae sp.]
MTQEVVGQGTMVFSGNFRSSVSSDQSSPDYNLATMLQQQQHIIQQQQQQQASGKSKTPHNTISKPPPSTRQQQSTSTSILHTLPQQISYTGYGSVFQDDQHQHHPPPPPLQPQQQQHEFHYGNPDYHDPYDNKGGRLEDDDDDDDGFAGSDDGPLSYFYSRERQQQQQQQVSWCERICCLYRPIVNLFQQENLHRSYCYGAIDGLLTGSGIVSAFWGLGVLSQRTPLEVRLAILTLAVAACVADSLCMALGHVWTTYVVASNHVEERSRERQLLEHGKAEAKGKLVDMLLARGMLKIDAMSLADTLEGYPDLFVSALMGDSLLAGSEEPPIDDEQSGDDGGDGAYVHGDPSSRGGGYHISYPGGNLPNDPAAGGGARDGPFGSFGSWKFPSYGQHLHSSHFDAETAQTHTILKESQKEGIFMMMGFSTFAVLPSLLWLFLPYIFPAAPESSSSSHTVTRTPSSSSSTTTAAAVSSPIVALPSVILLVLSAVVWCLGVWKSRFVDSNWMVFGMETIAVLLVCIFSAYCVAMVLAMCLGLELDDQGDRLLLLNEFISSHHGVGKS